MNLILIDLFFVIILLLTGLLVFFMRIKGKHNQNVPKPTPIRHPNYAILIPARNESKVIRGLLDSLVKQTYEINRESVYIIAESTDDPTVLIAQEYGAQVVVREHLELKRKGYALEEGIHFILKQGVSYDAYFIFDADNVLDIHYFKEMTKTYQAGYDFGIGYRNTKNGNESVIAACSSLTFSMINTLGNKKKNTETRNMVISGTGFYLRGELVEAWGSYPFHSLTEDYELTLASTLEGRTTFYNERAIFYDEQPTKYRVSAVQRTRWIKGFIACRKKYGSSLRKESRKKGPNAGSQFVEGIGILPVLMVVIGYVINLLLQIFFFIQGILSGGKVAGIVLHFFLSLLLLYVVLQVFTLILLQKEGKKINLEKEMKWKVFFFNPIFLISYVPCALKALFQRNIGWQAIEHHSEKVN